VQDSVPLDQLDLDMTVQLNRERGVEFVLRAVRGEVVVRKKFLRKKFLRKQLLHFTANVDVELIGMEACRGHIFWDGHCESRVMRCG
jgi:hypothetical protein